MEDVSARTYYYDCVGFTSYTVRIATPRAWGEIATVVNLANGRVPSPPRFVSFFSGLPAAPQANWESVATAASLRPGDLLAWSPEIEDTENNGHSVLVLSVPKPLGKGRFAVAVMDSTATPHGPDDTRHVANPLSQRNAPLGQLPGTSSKRRSDPTAPSGLGIGVIGLDTAPSGAVSGVEWTVGTRAEQVNFAAGRPSAAPPS